MSDDKAGALREAARDLLAAEVAYCRAGRTAEAMRPMLAATRAFNNATERIAPLALAAMLVPATPRAEPTDVEAAAAWLDSVASIGARALINPAEAMALAAALRAAHERAEEYKREWESAIEREQAAQHLRAEAHERAERAEQALSHYGEHRGHCERRGGMCMACTCGLDALVSGDGKWIVRARTDATEEKEP